MELKKLLVIVGFAVFSCGMNAQSELETLEKLHGLVMNDRQNEAKAKEIVLNYYYKTKDKVRENSSKLTPEEFKSLNSYQNITWIQITDAIGQYYSSSYYEFLSQNRELLKKYRERVLDIMYKYMYN